MTPGFDPLAVLRGNRVRLVLTSSTLLFVELLLIRWIPAEVRYIGFFSNFLLMASFLGIGIGILLGRRRSLDTIALFPILLLADGDGTAARIAEPIGWGFAWWGIVLYWLSAAIYLAQLRHLLSLERARR